MDGGLVQLDVGGLGAPSGGGEPLLGGLEVQESALLVAQAGPDPPFEPEQVEALGLAGGEPVAVGAEEAAGLAETAALDQEPDLVVDGGEDDSGSRASSTMASPLWVMRKASRDRPAWPV